MFRIMNLFGERYSRLGKLSNEEFHIPWSFIFIFTRTHTPVILASATASSPFLVELTGVVGIVRLDDDCAKHPLDARAPILCYLFRDVSQQGRLEHETRDLTHTGRFWCQGFTAWQALSVETGGVQACMSRRMQLRRS